MRANIDDYGDFSDDANTSGTPGLVPAEVLRLGWCWGAFGLGWIWAVGTGAYIAVLISLLPGIGPLWLGLSGHRLAWRYRRWADVRQYELTMRTWNRWGLVCFIAGVVFYVLYGLGILRFGTLGH